jgi:hypothetical protein
MMTRDSSLDDAVGVYRSFPETSNTRTGLMAIVVKKASGLTYKRTNDQERRERRLGFDWGFDGDSTRTRLGLIDSVLNDFGSLPATLGLFTGSSRSWLQHHHDATHQPSPYPTLRSPPFPPFPSPPSPYNFSTIFLSFFPTRPGSISRLSGASQHGLPSSAAAHNPARAYYCGPKQNGPSCTCRGDTAMDPPAEHKFRYRHRWQ